MAQGVNARTAWQIIAKKHVEFAKANPEWMSMANEALKAWGDQEMTLQHAVAVALSAAYGRGMRGEYPEPINYFDRYKEKDETDNSSSGSPRIVRRRNVATANGADHQAAEDSHPHVIRHRRARTGSVAEPDGDANAPRVIRRRS